ncbi:MAG: deoxyribodipyrimidine photo-lyase [Candidatus Deferrimicrobiaceae bacterium]
MAPTASGQRISAIVWFRRDLRISDNPALSAAVAGGVPVVPVYIFDPEGEGGYPAGRGSQRWLHGSLIELDRTLRRSGSRLVIRRGPSLQVLRELAGQTGASRFYWNRVFEPGYGKRDMEVAQGLENDGWKTEIFNGSLLFEPGDVCTSGGGPYRVFTPFWNKCGSLSGPSSPFRAPKTVTGPSSWPDSLAPGDVGRDAGRAGAGEIRMTGSPGEKGAVAMLARFLDEALPGYPENRDRPDLPGTSRLSPHIHFGEISPRQVWHAVGTRTVSDPSRGVARGAEAFLRQLGWREFAHHLLLHFPETPEQPLREEFAVFPWRYDERALAAWQRGETGYPLVDAGMRELRGTGWMHNRVRMIVASFLVKDLLLPWQEGARWFLDTLLDADLANNTLGWQWVAGCGADAAPFFRVYNPVGQGKKYDPKGDYVSRWVPELADLPARWIHCPWQAPGEVLSGAGVMLGKTYPQPIVDHAAARERSIKAWKSLKKGKISGRRK